ncbi:MAG: ComEA family DNA-binding protein [Eubacterium sp.]
MSKHSFSWKLKKSLWALPSLVGLAWVGFLHIGRKAADKKWRIAGIVYAFLQIGPFVIDIIALKESSPMYNKLIDFWMAMYFVGIIHSILTIKPYLRFCEEAENEFSAAGSSPVSLNTPDPSRQVPLPETESAREPEAMYTETSAYVPSDEFASAAQGTKSTVQGVTLPDENSGSPAAGDAAAEASSETAQAAGPAAAASQSQNAGIVSLSSCTAGQLAVLPGMTAEKAERALAYRHENGGFLSIDEFIAVADVPVEEEEKLRARVILG